MRRLTPLFILFWVLFPSNLFSQNNDRKETGTAISEFDVSITYPDIFTETLAHLLRFHTDRFILEERHSKMPDGKSTFFLSLKTQKSEWARMTNNNAIESFTELPLESKKAFYTNAEEFVEKLFVFFEEPTDTLFGLFDQGDKRLSAKAFPATSKSLKEFAEYKPHLVIITTHNADTGEPYIYAQVIVGKKEGSRAYPYVYAHLYEKDIKIVLRLKTLSIIKN